MYSGTAVQTTDASVVCTVCEHKHFTRKCLKGNGRGRIRGGKERGPPRYFVKRPPSSQLRQWR